MYEKPRVERFGTFRELTRAGWDRDNDGLVILSVLVATTSVPRRIVRTVPGTPTFVRGGPAAPVTEDRALAALIVRSTCSSWTQVKAHSTQGADVYQKPKVQRFGTFRELTQAGLTGSCDGFTVTSMRPVCRPTAVTGIPLPGPVGRARTLPGDRGSYSSASLRATHEHLHDFRRLAPVRSRVPIVASGGGFPRRRGRCGRRLRTPSLGRLLGADTVEGAVRVHLYRSAGWLASAV